MSRGAFIVLEGLDRSGKSTQVDLLANSIREQGRHARVQKFPDRTTPIGKMIDAYLQSKAEMDDRAIHLLFSANRWECAAAIERDLAAGTTVVADRYAFSGIAFSAAKGLPFDFCLNPDMGLPLPDITLYLVLSPAVASERGAFGQERYETVNLQSRVREQFKLVQEEVQKRHGAERWAEISADGTIEEVALRIKDAIAQAMLDEPGTPGTLWTSYSVVVSSCPVAISSMFEPHLQDYAHNTNGTDGYAGHIDGSGASLLDELDKLAPINSFDAFPKVQATYTSRSRRGGVLTAIVTSIIFLLVLNDLGEYLYGAPDYSFKVDQGIDKNLQLNVDITVAMPCHYITIDLRDAVGDRLHLSTDFVKDGTHFKTGKATSMKAIDPTTPSASEIISSAKRNTPNQRRSASGLRRLFSPKRRVKKNHAGYRPTHDKVDNGPACRVYGSIEVKKVTANLHITTLGHGYMSYEHTDHALMNLSHIVHEFSFGPFFPAIAQPLDQSYQSTQDPFTIFQYFLRVVPTTYIDANRRKLVTSQYAVTDYSRSFEHGKGVPGIFFKYDLEAMSLIIRERTTSLYQFLIRLAGVVGGVWTVASFGLRVFNRAQKEVTKVVSDKKEYIPSSVATPSPSLNEKNSSYFGPMGGGMSRSTSWVGANGGELLMR